MLKQIGMDKPEHIEKYLNHLETLYGRMKSFYSESYYNGIGWFYSVSDCMKNIIDEIQLKKSKSSIKKISPSNFISATDISNFSYCPVSYSIHKSFEIEKPSGIEYTEIGTNFHEQLRLIPKTNFKQYEESDRLYNDVINIIRASRIVFCGHNEDIRVFRNEKFIGTPDYIFQDPAGQYFVVEEKFHRKHDPEKVSSTEIMNDNCGILEIDEEAELERKKWKEFEGYFFQNHILQVLSYIKNITDYKIDYGYLIYWYYDFENEQPYIHKVVTKKINLDTETDTLLNSSVELIERFISNKQIEFLSDKLNMKKCAGCVVNKYCGHKNGRFNILTIPYDLNFLNLYYVEFPPDLKRQ